MKIEFKFNLMDRVHITELNRKGRVIALFICEGGTSFKVRYFDNGDAKETYFFEDEIEIVT